MKKGPIRVCLISVEIFAYGKFGGFGKVVRIIGSELVKRGYEVFAVVPRRLDQPAEETMDGITVLGYLPGEVLKTGELYKKINADIYHSCEPSFATYIAQKHMPNATHVSTIQDPRDAHDWYLEFLYPSLSKFQVIKNYLYETNFLVRKIVRHSDGVYSPTIYMVPKVRKIYGLSYDPVFLPTPVDIPEPIEKSAVPKVLFMARIDPRKRPAMFLALAEKFPEVEFHVAGKSRVPEYEIALRKKYNQANIIYHGFIDQFHNPLYHELMGSSWILINPAIREGLPNAYLEAAAYRTAILSYVDPDGFASNFGFHAPKDNFVEGLQALLDGNKWKEQGLKGHQYVSDVFATPHAMDRHEEEYAKAMKNK